MEKDYIENFAKRAISPEDFDHKGHLYMAWVHLKWFPFQDANQKICTGIHDLATQFGAPEKYHRTLSEAFVRIVQSRLNEETKTCFECFVKENRDLIEDSKSVLAQYYSHSRLYSAEAKSSWVQPDLQDIT
ncbi:hypothetical protein [Terasakiella sp. SH-1]|uniref:hypothetical protein n=1 Tax=Terasakiella sp. SH-1 TaxID=2560057 RepID=UPI0010733BA3|nr:hypothetical protein [Terasakiella sp. SH-1]